MCKKRNPEFKTGFTILSEIILHTKHVHETQGSQ